MPTRSGEMTVGRKMDFTEVLLLIVGAVVGVLLRYALAECPVMVGPLQVNVLAVNVVGSLILGFFSAASIALNLDMKYSLFVAVGFCGSFTTMSTFALETSNLLDSSRFYLAALNVFANVGLSLGAVVGGRALGTLALERFVG